jgi:signal transduction histidine kinase
MQRNMSLRARLLLVMGVALLPLFAVAIWGAVRDADAATAQAEVQLKFSASVLAANQERAIDAAEQLLGAIAATPGLRAMDPAQCQSYFENLRHRFVQYTNVALFDANGRGVCDGRGSPSVSVSDRDYFRDAVSQQRFVMGEPIVGRASGRAGLPFAMPVIEHGQVVAVVLAALDLDQAAQSLSRVRLPPGATVAVVDAHGHVLMQYPRESGNDGDAINVEAATGPVGGQQLTIRVTESREQLLRDARQRARQELIAIIAVMVFAIGAFWGIGGRMIVKPAKQIVGAVRRLEQGKLDARVLVQSTALRGEFARIGSAFNLMAESLQARQSDVEAELGRSRSAYAMLDSVLNSMQEGLVVVGADGRFLLHNRAAQELFPLDTAPLLPELWPEHFGIHHLDGVTLYRADDLPFVRSALGESEGQVLLRVRNAFVPDGRLLQCTWHSMQGESVRGGLVMFTDVTELQRLQAEQAAHFAQLEEAQRKLIESQRIGRIGNWELDLRSGELWWSDQVFELFGIAPQSFGGDLHSFESRVHPGDRHLLKPARDRALIGGVMQIEYRIVKPDGSIAWMFEVGDTRRDAVGEPIWYGGMVQDITQRKLAEIENARLLAEVQQLNVSLESRIAERTAQLQASNAELEAFAYSVSHDLRAPLAAISGFAGAVEDKLGATADERVIHYITRIRVGVRKMEELIEALLQLSRVVRAEVESVPVNLSLLARETIENLQVNDARRTVETRVAEGLVTRGDPRLLRIVLENLIGNAWKFTSTTKHAVIEVGRTDEGEFFVRDNGVGFDMTHAGKLFTAFQRLHTESEFPGTGIGLATVRRVIARHQGYVRAESQLGRGTTFYFSLGAA